MEPPEPVHSDPPTASICSVQIDSSNLSPEDRKLAEQLIAETDLVLSEEPVLHPYFSQLKPNVPAEERNTAEVPPADGSTNRLDATVASAYPAALDTVQSLLDQRTTPDHPTVTKPPRPKNSCPEAILEIHALFDEQSPLSTAPDSAQTHSPNPTTAPASTTEKKPPDKVEVPFMLIGNDTRSVNVKSILMHRAIELKHRQIGERYLAAVTTPEFRLGKPKLMYLADPLTQLKFLIDSGSEISVMPRSPSDRLDEKAKYKLKSANGTAIRTYGTKVVKIKVGSRYLKWTFVIADVTRPILGIDFMKAHGLIIDPADNCLVNRVTAERIPCQTAADTSRQCLKIEITDPVLLMLQKKPELIDESTPTKKRPNVVHYIHTEGPPPRAQSRHYNPKVEAVIRQTFEDYLKLGYVRYSDSNWSSPLAVVAKADGSFRVCGDYRGLNRITRADHYPLPYLASFNARMAGSRIYSKIDLVKAYHQISVYKGHIHKTAVSTPGGLFEFVRMPFGLRTASQTFQRFMDTILKRHSAFSFCFIDDIIVFSETEEQHREHLQIIFDQLANYGLKINVKKSIFSKQNLDFLGYRVDRYGVQPTEEKVRSITSMPLPKTVGDVKRYLGMIGYYARHIRNFALIRQPLNRFLSFPKGRNNSNASLNPTEIKAFEQLNEALANAALLYHPNPNATLTLHTDASSTGIAAVLNQINPENEQLEPLFFFSRAVAEDQKSRPIYYQELEAAYQAVKRLNKYLIGQKTILFVDNAALYNALSSPKDQPPLILRRLLTIDQHVDEFVLIRSQENVVADALSRYEHVAELSAILLEAKVDYAKLFEAQQQDPWIAQLTESDRFKRKQKMIENREFDVWFFETVDLRELICVPESKVNEILQAVHEVFHPGRKATTRMVADRFYWPTLKKDTAAFVRTCIECQRCKVLRHNAPVPNRIDVPEQRFKQIHVDLVGPLPLDEGDRYLLTMTDRTTRFLVVEPLPNQDTISVWRAILKSWVQYFGIPHLITSDRGSQFNNLLFHYLCKSYRIRTNHTTAYHPQPNGILEREHRKLKSSLMALRRGDWRDRIATIVLGWNNAVREDYRRTPAQLLFGTNCTLPCDFFDWREQPELTPEAAADLQGRLDAECEAYRTNRHSYIYKEFRLPGLNECEFVWVRNDARHGLAPHYKGPYKVLERQRSYFVIERKPSQLNGHHRPIERPNQKKDTVSIARIKPAFFI